MRPAVSTAANGSLALRNYLRDVALTDCADEERRGAAV